MKVLILKCRDCGQELNRTVPVTDEQAAHARLNSPFNTGKCPNGCRSTFSDLNLNADIEEIEADA